jgi:folylpolyglutamate synthase
MEGLKAAKWPGRCQTVSDPAYGNLTWFLDGAHTVESLECCMEWFISPTTALKPTILEDRTRLLIFNCTNGRSGDSFLKSMYAKIAAQLKLYGSSESAENIFDHVVFCTNVTYADGEFKGDLTTLAIPENDLAHLQTQHTLAKSWSSIYPDFPLDRIHVLPSIEHAVNLLRNAASRAPVDVLVTGSLHLIGGIIEVAGLSDVAL